jgi:hypothetical protein
VERSAELGRKKRKKLTAEQQQIMADRVDLDDGEMLLARTFRRLATCRHELSQIHVTAIWQWQDREGIVDRGLRAFTEAVIVSLDLAELKRLTRKRPPRPPAPNRPPPRARRPSKHV